MVEDVLNFDKELAVRVQGTAAGLRNITLRVAREFEHPDWTFMGETTVLSKGAEPSLVLRVEAKAGGAGRGGGSIGIIEYEELFGGTTRIRIPPGRGGGDPVSAWSHDPDGVLFSGFLKALIVELLQLAMLERSIEPRPLGFRLPRTEGHSA